MDVNCVYCGTVFHKLPHQKTYGRKSLGSSLRVQRMDKKINDVLKEEFDIDVTPLSLKQRFLCDNCVKNLANFSKAKKTSKDVEKQLTDAKDPKGYIALKMGKKPITPVKTPRIIKKLRISGSPLKKPDAVPSISKTVQTTRSLKGKRASTENEVDRALMYIKRRQYETGFRLLMKSRTGARKAFVNILKKEVRLELKKMLSNTSSSLRGEGTLEQIEKFSWNDTFQEMKTDCPMLTSTLVAATTSQKTEKYMGLRFKPNVSAISTVGVIAAVIAYRAKPYMYKLVQQLNSTQLWLSGCKREAFGRFNHLGLCVGIKGTRNIIDKIRVNYNNKVKVWKEAVSDRILMREIDSNGSSSDTIPYTESSNESSDSQQAPVGQEHRTAHDNVAENCSFSLCFDNVNQKVTVRHQTRDKKNKIFNMVQAYCAKDRIPSLHLDDTQPTPDVVQNIPMEKYLPTLEDEETLKEEIVVMIERILVQTVPVLKDLSGEVTWHIEHPYSVEMARKSEMVPLGVLDKDESKVADMVEILDEYTKYVPLHPNGLPVVTPLHADGLSCERINDAQNARINATTAWSQLQSFEANIQEWHKRCILYQDTLDDLYSGKSSRDKGTLYQLKNYFCHRNVTGNVKESFNYVEEFIEFVTMGYVTLAALHFMHINELDEIPQDFPQTAEDRVKFLKSISKSILELIFTSSQQLVRVIMNTNIEDGDDDYKFCICKTEKAGAKMIFCDNRKCPRGQWFHLECVDMDEDDVPENAWFCSTGCKSTAQKGKKKKSTVANRLMDGKRDYVRALIWRGLNHLVRKDAIKEGDGERIILHWKFDLLEFYDKSHPKYFIFCHRLLSNVNGAASNRLKHTLIWNRTVNPKGGKGNNIPMDLQMEFFNREYKESVKDAAGQLTEATIARHSQMVSVGKALTFVYDQQVASRPSHTRTSGKPDKQKYIKDMVELLQPEDFFTVNQGRHHGSFPEYEFKINQKVVARLFKARLTKHLKFMADRRKITLTNRD